MTVVSILKEDGKPIKVFSNHETAHKFMIKTGVEYEQNFLTSRWRLEDLVDEHKYVIKRCIWYLYVFYYECVDKTFEIEEMNVEC
jgi:hypothetical protein